MQGDFMSVSSMRKMLPIVSALLLASAAWAKPKMEVNITATKQVTVMEKGKKVTKHVPADTAAPGDVIEYKLAYANRGDEKATDAVVADPIPKGTVYVENSATGDGAEVTFSSDGGKTFAKALMLTYEIKSPITGKLEKRVATPSEYTHIRWMLKEVPPGASGTLAFQVRVK
jgi:uncharacterized repeat protein (TIGR01451 family)